VVTNAKISIRLTDDTGKQIVVNGRAAIAIMRIAEVQSAINSEHFKGKIVLNVGTDGNVDASAELTVI
jgi:type 1 fimbria pilin